MMIEKIKKYIGPLCLSGLALWLGWSSFHSGNWMFGWDNLAPELNPVLNLQRTLSAVWQGYRGLGHADGMAQAADLSRQLILLPFDAVLPANMIRFFWLLLMLALGPLGVYVFVNSWGENKKHAELGGLVAGAFYLMNLATVQYFHTPFEPFLSFYGFLPWLLWAAWSYLKKGGKHRLRLVGMIGFLATSAFLVQTLFIVYMIPVGLLILGSIATLRKTGWNRSWKLGGMIIGVNSFWLLPTIYFAMTQASVVANATANILSTADMKLINRAFGDPISLMLLRGFSLDYTDWKNSGEFGYLMEGWHSHANQIGVVLMGLVLFGLSLCGIVWHFRKKRDFLSWWPLFVLVVSLFMLTGGSGIFGVIFNVLAKTLPLFSQVFRAVHTKWSIVAAFVYAGGLGLLIQELIQGNKQRKIFAYIITSVSLLGMVWMVKPAFTGNLIYQNMWVDLPDEYYELFKFMDAEPEGRVASFPVQSFWGWNCYDWGYRGSGFLWYGIKQPILDRAFDVWSPHNETFYNEFSTVLYGCEDVSCAGSVERVLQKYNVSLALLDESVIVPNGDREQLRIPIINEVMTKLGGKPVFQEGKLTLWNLGKMEEMEVTSQWREIDAQKTYGRVDPWFNLNNPYIHSENGSVYPLAGLSSEKPELEVSNGLVVIKTQIRDGNFRLVVPPIPTGTKFAGRARVVFNEQEIRVRLLPLAELTLGDKTYPVWLDQEWVVQLSTPLSDVVVGVNGSYQFVKMGESVELGEIPLVAGQPVVVDVFDAGQGRQISASRLGMIEKDNLIKHNYADKKTCIGVESFDYKCLPERAGFVKTRETGIHWFDVLGEEMTRPFEAVVYPQIAKTIMDAEAWSLIRYEWDNVESGNLAVRMPVEIRKLAAEGNGDNCDVLKRGKVLKKTIKAETEYQAEKYGALCDGLAVSGSGDLVNQLLVKLNGENKKGRGLKASIYSDMQNRTVIESLLSAGNFEEYLGLWPVNANEKFSMTLETRSFGSDKSANTVTSMESFNLPLSWLQEIALIKEMAPKAGSYEITNLTKSGTWKYSVKLSGQGDGLMILHQGFDKGWVAFQGFKTLSHVKVNGWANGWIINPGDDNPGIVVFFWPQLLEWLGLGLLFGIGFVRLGKRISEETL